MADGLNLAIGRLLRSATTGFVFGCSVPEPEVPRFGDLVKAPAQRGRSQVLGLIYDIVIEDDPFVRQMIAAPDLDEAYILDQRENRQVPLEVAVLSIGYYSLTGSLVCALPPQPPVTLDRIEACSPAEWRDCTAQFDFLRLVLNAPDVPADELIVVALRNAATARPPEDQRPFRRAAGRELARLLSRDLPRLENLLRRIQS
ncbi:MAG: hypothetical protein IT317_04660 [Anaerolineales bacterium]|nr:hypothetical protein [Anaerolineales bacterium]